MAKDAGTDLYSIRVDYEPVPSEQQPTRGEWYLKATLIHEYHDASRALQTDATPLGRIDVDALDSVEQRTSFWAATSEALNSLGVEGEVRDQITAELALVVRLPTDDVAKQPRIGLGAVFPDRK